MVERPLLSLRWAPEIILALAAGPKRYNWLLQDLAGISDRVLTERLRDLEDAKLLVRQVDGGPPVRVYYQLTDAGHHYVGPLEQLRLIERGATTQEVTSQAS